MLSKEKIIMVKKTTCHLKLQNHKWMISFTYHGKEECFYLCKEDALPEPHILGIWRGNPRPFNDRDESAACFYHTINPPKV